MELSKKVAIATYPYEASVLVAQRAAETFLNAKRLIC